MKALCNLADRLNNSDLAALFIRISLGVVFIIAGWMKVSNMAGTIGFFATIGIPAWLTYIVAYAELIGGIMAILGILVRYAGIVLAIIMLVACKILFAKGFSAMNGGYEYPFTLMLASLAMTTLGAGKYSLCCFKCFKK